MGGIMNARDAIEFFLAVVHLPCKSGLPILLILQVSMKVLEVLKIT